jgi:mannose-6-phosphate isomerase-like protein (cupin superfamily)
MAAPDVVVNLAEKFAKFSEHWSPKIVGQVNDLHIKAVKVKGQFLWHQHDDTDEVFLVISGTLRIQLENRDDVEIGPGQFFVVPRGVRHCPEAENECELLLLEPAGTINTGETHGDLTATVERWI